MTWVMEAFPGNILATNYRTAYDKSADRDTSLGQNTFVAKRQDADAKGQADSTKDIRA